MDQESELAALVAAAHDGDQRAWDEIVDRYSPLLVTVLLRYRLSSAELQDVAQTVWLRVIENLGRIREPRALPGWIVTTARREALRVLEVSRRLQPQDPQDELWASRLVSEDDPDAALERSERRAALLEGFATLNGRQRKVLLLLSEDPPVPYAEISRRTGVPVGAIGPTRARALERLRQVPSVRALDWGVGAETNRGEGHV
jgi:RNA polymerase sigma factor (sigma-70 family)